MADGKLFPPIEPRKTGMLKVSELHSMYYEVSGNPEGRPVLVVHGGPGSGSRPIYRQFYDPEAYMIILFDQRGAGQSTPFCELKENTTFDLVEDMEKLRLHLEIDKWVLAGGSWGSTLALTYACCHADRVMAIVMFGILTCRKSEIDWLFNGGAGNVFPEYWQRFADPIPEDERGDMVQAYHKRITGDDPEEVARCALAWSQWECASENFLISEERIRSAGDDWAICRAKHECHYLAHGGFFSSRWPREDNALLDQIEKTIQHVPGTIVQSRYDMICPMKTAWDLHQRWKKAEFVVVPDAGHSPAHPNVQAAFLKAIDRFKDASL
eukprot:scpid57835/ scgid0773/ Proline iminopeptidase; Prolyl aminopeptidase